LFAASFFLGQTAGVALASLAVEWVGTRAVLAAGGVGVLLIALLFALLRARENKRAPA
jgi:predicted MFS family arabinose efflux permease